MGESGDGASSPGAEPLAKTRTRRSNAGARMHEMMFNAEDDEMLAQAYGIIKAEDESSDDEEYVPKDLQNDHDTRGEADDEDGDCTDDSSGSSSEEDSETDDEDEEEDDNDMERPESEEREGPNDGEKKVKKEEFDVKLSSRVKLENGAVPTQSGSPTKAAYDACSRICSVCLGDQSDEDDEIIECDSCGVTVHEACYGVSDEDNSAQDNISVHSNISSESTEPWFCEPCRRSVREPYCELCPNTGGIYKRTDTGRWVHMVCALYIRGVTFENISDLTSVSLFELNYATYGSKACTICEDRRMARSGVCIGCDAGLCKNFFHPTCAQKEGLLFESHIDEVDPYFAQCKQHADKSVIKKKKKRCTALLARLKRVQPFESRPQRIKDKLVEMTRLPDPCLTRWTPEHKPPIPQRVSRMLLTSPSLIIKLTKKSELLGLDPTSAFMTIQDEMEMARQKWHIPPAFNLEFIAYCIDRETRMVAMKKRHSELMVQNAKLKQCEASLREQYNSYKDSISYLKSDINSMIRQMKDIQKTISSETGKQFNLPAHIETLIEKCSKAKAKTPCKNSKSITKTSTTYGCAKCKTVKDQHLLALCDTCLCHFHIYCLDPPLSRVPKKTKFGGWQCSDCSERDEEEQEEAIEEQNTIAIQEADGPRRLRERIIAPDKYCHESMTMADFWSTSKSSKKKSKKSSSKTSKIKKPKLEV